MMTSRTRIRRSAKARPQRKSFNLLLEILEDRTLLNNNLAQGIGTAGNPSVNLTDNLYQVLLQRTPRQAEIDRWVAAFQAGLPAAEAARQLLASQEYRSEQIRQGFVKLVGREPEAGAVDHWLEATQPGLTDEQVTAALLSSEEYSARHGGTQDAWVAAVYGDVLGRTPDAAGLAFWVGRLQHGATRQDVVQSILDSPEAHTLLVSATYQNVLRRLPEAQGLEYWTKALDGGLSREGLTAQIVGSSEFAEDYSGAATPGAGGPGLAVRPLSGSGSGSGPGPFIVAHFPVDTPPIDDCACGPISRELVRSALGVDGYRSASRSIFGAGVRYFDGSLKKSTSDLTSEGFGTGWGQTRSWSNDINPNGPNGSGEVVSQQPYLIQVLSPSRKCLPFFEWKEVEEKPPPKPRAVPARREDACPCTMFLQMSRSPGASRPARPHGPNRHRAPAAPLSRPRAGPTSPRSRRRRARTRSRRLLATAWLA
jgi:hypothetical protein